MDNKFYQDDELEQFLQEEVKQHRMYPSDHIWKNIRTELHGNRAWPALTFISLFIISALTVSTLLNNHPVTPVAVQPTASASYAKNNVSSGAAPSQHNTIAGEESKHSYFQRIDPAKVTAETFARVDEDNDDALAMEPSTAYTARSTELTVAVKNSSDRINTTRSINRKLPVPALVVVHPVADGSLPAVESMIEENKTATTETGMLTEDKKETEQPDQLKKEEQKKDIHSNADEFLKDFNYVTSRPKPRDSRFGVQFYITPSTSYRRLSDQQVKDVIQQQPTSSNVSVPPLGGNTAGSVNNVVRHKPAVGLELGFALLYNMSSKVKFKTGLQLNVRQYYIETYQSLTNDLTSLSLINYRGVETINFYTPYNNNTGYKQTTLDNQVYQVSLPLGLQFEVLQGRHFGITTEASVQPTITLNKNTYLLSTDYKHYTTGNNYIRKWNVNTSVGINLTYQSRKSSFQVGPQVRYQHLPTYSNSYPIKEYLLDYGIRVGYTRQLW